MRGAAHAESPGAAAVVESRSRRGGSGLGAIAFVVLGLTLGALGHVAVQAKRLEVALALGNEERIHRELREQRRHLEIEIGMLKNLDRISDIANKNLGMALPSRDQIRPLRGPEVAAGMKGGK